MGSIVNYKKRTIKPEDIGFIRALITIHYEQGRYALSRRIYCAWGLVQPYGQLKEMICQRLLLSLAGDLCGGRRIRKSVCAFGTIEMLAEGERRRSQVTDALCKGCGACAAACPSGAIEQKGFRPDSSWRWLALHWNSYKALSSCVIILAGEDKR